MLKQRLSWDCKDESSYERLIDCIAKHPGGCDEVWFSVVSQFPPLDVIEKNVGFLKPYFAALKELGVKASVQIKTFGDQTARTPHYDFRGVRNMRDELFSVDQKGNVNFGQFCWRKKEYRDYERQVISLLCRELNPFAIWFDDDIRVFNYKQPLRCFCEDCIAEFNRENGTSYTREELDALIGTDVDIREKYLNFSYRGISDYCREMGRVIRENSETTHAGVQHGSYSGKAFAACIRAFHEGTGRTVMSRSGGGAYNDDDPNVLVEKTFDTQWQLYSLPDCVEDKCNEIENWPNVFYSKTMNGTMLEATLHLASGFNSVSFVLTNLREKEMILEGIAESAKRRRYWEKLRNANNGCVKGGLSVVVPEKYWATNKKEWMFEPWKTGHGYNYLGIPVTYAHPRGAIRYLAGEYAETLTESEITELAGSFVVTTGRALEILEKRGYRNLFGVHAHPVENAFPFYEKYTDHPANASLKDDGWGQSLFVNVNHYLEGENMEVLSIYAANNPLYASSELCGKAAAVIFDTKAGGKWFVQGYRQEDNILTFDKKRQIDAAIGLLGGLPCRIVSKNRLMLLPAEDEQGRIHSVTFANTTIERQKNARIEVRNPAAGKAVFCDEYGKEQILETGRNGKTTEFTLPEILPWTACTVFFEPI